MDIIIDKLLVVEDEDEMRSGIVETLKKDFVSIYEARNGAEAIEAAARNFGMLERGIVLLDIMLPDMSGIEVLKKIKSENINLFVIMVTALKDTKTAVEALSEGASDYITKPFKIDELIRKVKDLYRNETLARNMEFVCKKLDKWQADFDKRHLLTKQYEAGTGRKIPADQLLKFVSPPLNGRLEFGSYEELGNDIKARLKNKVDIKPGQSSILIVDDEEEMRSGLSRLLKTKYKTSSTGDGKETLGIFKKGLFDLILLDIRLPDMTGIELLKEIRKIDSDVCVIMVTALKDIEVTVDAMNAGASDYITKPFKLENVTAAVAQQLELKYHKKRLEILIEQLKKETATFG